MTLHVIHVGRDSDMKVIPVPNVCGWGGDFLCDTVGFLPLSRVKWMRLLKIAKSTRAKNKMQGTQRSLIRSNKRPTGSKR